MSSAETEVIGVYASPESLERAGDALVRSGSFSDSDIYVLLPQDLQGDAKTGAFLLSVSCSTSQKVQLARRIIECTEVQASFSSKIAFLSAANIASGSSRQN
jgi:hypothetical protein